MAPRPRPAALAAALAFALAFGVMAADVRWNVVDTLVTPAGEVDLADRTYQHLEPDRAVPNATDVGFTFRIHADRPIGFAGDVRVASEVGPDRPLPPDGGPNASEPPEATVHVDERVALAAGEVAELAFTVDTTRFAREGPPGGGIVGFVPLVIERGSATYHVRIPIQEDPP